ncbi:cell cycle checkpoint protein RAD17 isoform 1-T1 [Menidia menidia]
MSKVPLRDAAAPGRVKHWVDPSFSDLPEKSFSAPGRRKASQSLGSRPELKRQKKKGLEVGSGQLPPDDQDEPWVERYSPRTQAELAVHKKKIEEVENWIRAHTDTPKGGILILTGPSGCGKTATVQVLSMELGVRVQEWTNPSAPEPFSSTRHDWKTNGFSSQLGQFQEFLLRAHKYNCLKMKGDAGATEKKLVLVEDFPNQFYRQPGSLHAILRHFVRSSRCPLLFVVSDSPSGNGSFRSLFPRELQEELGIACISFNPVAPTTMMKVLNSILAQEAGRQSCRGMSRPDQPALESLCSGSSGDVRSAINSLQFLCLPDASLEKESPWPKQKAAPPQGRRAPALTNQRMKRCKRGKEQEDLPAVGGRDVSLVLFRALGKVLHCKREHPSGAEAAEDASAPGLPDHLLRHHRSALLINPELVVERSHMSGDMFNLYLYQNYLDFFSEMEDVVRASEYLSDADLLTAEWSSRGTMGDYGSSVATRGLLHSNSHQVSVGFRPLHKPSWLLVSKQHRDNCLAARSLFADFCLTPLSLQTQLVPYLAKLVNPLRSQAQISFIQDVGQMSLRRPPGRLKLETLTDKDTGPQEEEDGEEEDGVAEGETGQGGAADGLPASQPRPVSNQVLLEDEDMIIEEYTSD